MTNDPLGFRPTKKARQFIEDYMVVNELKGRGALTRAINEIVEAHEKTIIFDIMRYRLNRKRCKTKE